MKTDTKIGYTVLRYVHDIATQEFVNIGVLAYAPESRTLKLRCLDRLRRVHALFPDCEPKRLTALIRHVQDSFDSYACILADSSSTSDSPQDVMKAAIRVLPTDSSALQWSSPAGGYAESLSAALDKAFHRHVQLHDVLPGRRSKGIGAVLEPFKRGLKAQGVLGHLKPKGIKGTLETYQFDHAWKNHVYHCYEPVNLDLRDHKKLEARAMEWVGRAKDLGMSKEDHRLYLLLAKPVSRALQHAYKDTAEAMKLLLPPTAEVVQQDNILEFTLGVAESIKTHYNAVAVG